MAPEAQSPPLSLLEERKKKSRLSACFNLILFVFYVNPPTNPITAPLRQWLIEYSPVLLLENICFNYTVVFAQKSGGN